MGFAQTNSFTLSSSIGLTSDFTSNARIADFDNDGDNDIANFDGVGGNYRLYKNNGNGTFANTFTELIPVTNQAIETGDLDNDGDIDIVCTNGRVYINNGSGTFSQLGSLLIKQNAGGTIAAIKITDINNDGKNDIIWANSSNGANAFNEVWLNTGTTGNAAFTYSTGFVSASTNNNSIDIADIDADGDKDVVIGGFDNAVQVFKNASGVFTFQTHTGTYSFKVVLNDWDKDGDLDLITWSPYNGVGVRVFLNNGSGTFGTTFYTSTIVGASVDFGDLNGDGYIDAVISNGSVTPTSILINNGCGLAVQPYTVNAAPHGAILGELSGDGKLDIFCMSRSGTSTNLSLVYLNDLSLANVKNAPGNALKFDGVNDYISIPDANNLDITTNYTIEAWINVSSFTALAGIVSKYQTVGSNGYLLRLGSSGTFSGIGFDGMETVDGILQAGKWYHIAATKSGGTRSLYVNGVAQTLTGTGITTAVNTDELRIGSDFNGRYFNGMIDEVRIWNTARTSTEISTNNKNILGCTNTGLVAYYKFYNGTAAGSNAAYYALNDVGGDANNGLLKNFALTGTTSNWVESYAMVVPTATAATSIVTTSFTANWAAPIVGTVTNYLLDVSTSSTFASFVSGYNGLSVAGTSQSVTSLSSGTTYYYRVRADKTSVTGQGGYSSSITTTTSYTPPGNALNFDAVNDNVSIPSVAGFGVNKVTIETWVYWTPNSASDVQFIYSKGLGAGSEVLEMHTGGLGANYLRILPRPNVYIDVANALQVNKWTHIAYVHDPSTSVLKVYINGVDRAYTVTSGSVSTALTTNANPFCIGKRASNEYYFKGSIDEFRLWNVTRTQAEIQANMFNTISSSTSGLFAYYNFDNGLPGATNTGLTTLADQTSNANNGTLNNFALTGATSNWVESYAMVIPTTTTATNIANTSFTANWTAPTVGTVTNYLLDVSTSSTFSSFVSGYNGLSVAGTSQSVTSLTAGTTYYYRVQADKTSVTGQGGYSSTITATTLTFLNNIGITSTQAASAYSLRKLNSDYTGAAIEVRRSSDNSTQNIGFTANGDLDTTALKTFVGSGNGFVTIWYDQSGNTRNLTEVTSSKQPGIVNAGIMYRRNGKPTLYLDGSDDGMIYSGATYLNSNPITVNLVAGSNANSNALRRAIQGSSNWLVGPYGNQHSWFAGNWNHQISTPWSTTLVEYFTVTQPTSNSCTSFRNGVSQTSANNKGLPGKINLGTEGAYSEPLNGYISEVISYSTELNTTDRQSMEASQLAYYPIPSTNANLSTLSTTAGAITPIFDAATTAYTASVTNATSSVTVTPNKADANATIQVQVNNGGYSTVTSGSASAALSLNVGSNTIDVKVTAQDGTTVKTYTITVMRAASANADLSALTTTAGTISPTFDAATTAYTASVTNAITSVTVTPTKSDANATIQVQVNNGGYSTVNSGSASAALSLNVGSNTIDVKVTAQDGTTIKTYTITVTRAVSTNTVYYHSFNTGSVSASEYNTAPDIIATGLLVGSTQWTGSGTTSITNCNGSNSLAVNVPNLGSTRTLTLTLNVASAYTFNLTGISTKFISTINNGGFAITVNGNPYYSSASVLNACPGIAVTQNTPLSLTGTVTIVISAVNSGSNAQNFAIDDFILNGTLTTSAVYFHQFNSGSVSGSEYNTAPDIIATGLSVGSTQWTGSGTTSITNCNGSNSLAVNVPNLGSTRTLTLTLNVASAYTFNLTGISTKFISTINNGGFAITVNGNPYYSSASVLNACPGIAVTQNTPLSLTGTVTIVISAVNSGSNAQNFAIDDFILNGTLTTSAVYFHQFNSGSVSGSDYNTVPDVLASNLTVGSPQWTGSGTTSITNCSGNGKLSVAVPNLGSTRSLTLSLNVASGYRLNLTGISFKQNSTINNGGYGVKVNGTTYASSASVLSACPGVTLSGNTPLFLTGTVSIEVYAINSGTGTQNLSIDDFIIDGTFTATIGNALNFDGTNDYVNCGNNANLNITGSLSLEAMVYRSSLGTDDCIIGKDNFTSANGYSFWLFADNKLGLRFGNRTYRGISQLPQNKWIHVAGVYNASTSAVSLYINGNLDTTYSTVAVPVSNTLDLYLGTPQDATGNSTYSFWGSLEEVRIWNMVRSKEDIQTNMYNFINPASAGLMAYYNFNEGVSGGSNTGITVLNDKTSNANNGTLNNFALTGATSNWIASTAWNTWLGAINNNYATATNWDLGTTPTTNDNIVIPTGASNLPVSVTTAQGFYNGQVQTSASLINTNTLSIAGNLFNSGMLTSTAGTIAYNGNTPQQIAASTFTDNSIKGLTINNEAGVSLNGALTVSDVVTPTSGTLATNNFLTLSSNATTTARIAAGTGTYISGNVTVQRYIPGGRRTSRFIGHPFSNALSMNSLIDDIYVTGAGGTANGFDATSTNNPSAFWFDNSANQTWTPFTSVSNANWTQYRGIRLLVRGDRNQPTTLTGANPTPNAVTLDMDGVVNMNNQNIAIPTGYSVVSNPYPSPINLGSRLNSTSNIGTQYWVWDANGGVSAGSYITKIIGGGAYNLAMSGAFVVNPTSATTINFVEADKQTTQTANLFRNTTTLSGLIELKVLYNNYPVDNMFVRFNSNSSDSQEVMDGTKLLNPEVNMYAISADNKKQSLDTRPFAENKVIPLGFTATTANSFKIVVEDFGLTEEVYLKDKYLNITTQLLVGVSYSFNVDPSTPATLGENRFELIMKTNTALPSTFLNVTAAQKNDGIQVSWTTANEQNMESYTIEKGTNGNSFEKAITVQSKNEATNSYSWFDGNIVNGNNYYRIKSTEKNGVTKYSNIVKVNIGSKDAEFTVYPNPVKGKVVSLQMSNVEKGTYTIRLFNNIGQEVANKTINHNGGSSTQSITLSKKIAAGSYNMQISNGNNTINKIVIVE